jgi:Uma2 family endonuclease
MSASVKIPDLMTVDEFLVWEPDDTSRYELVDGVPVAMAPTSNAHAMLQSRLDRLIGNHLEATRPGCEVMSNPGVIPKRRPKINFRIPDLGVTCAPVVPTENSVPEPVLLVEILSPSNQSDTMANVWTYTSIPSVTEILVLHSDRVAVDLLRRAEDGTWPDRTTAVGGDTLELASIGLSLTLAQLYAGIGH